MKLWFECFVSMFGCILASSRITWSGSWKTDPSFLRWFYHIGVASFFIGGLWIEPLAFWGYLFCRRRSLIWANERKLQWCTFIHGFGLSSVTAFVKYGASVPSDFDNGDQCFGDITSILMPCAYEGSASLKTSPLAGFFCEEEYGPWKCKCIN
jgi:hypothetical protein